MRIAILMVTFGLLAGCADVSPQPGDAVTLKPAATPNLIAGERSPVSILADATSPAGETRSVQLDGDALSGRVDFFDADGNLVRYERVSFEYG